MKKFQKEVIDIPKKRRSGGHTGSSKGNYGKVQCSNCGRFVARSKAKKFTTKSSLIDSRMYKELKKEGTIILGGTTNKYYCISCAIHKGKVAQRAKVERKGP
ncbi:MAG: 30S ribosomal protein S26e [Promethearchaeota archaeon]